MSFVGILTDNKNNLKHTFKENDNTTHLFFLNEESIANVKNIKFETIMISKKIDQNQEMIRNIVKNAKYLILNSDEKENVEVLQNLKTNLITYGFNMKSTITISSIQDENIMICLQRAINSSKGEVIEPQEFKVKQENKDVYLAMEEAVLMLLYPNLYKGNKLKLY